MGDLLVRGVEDQLVARLRERAAAHGVSAQAEHLAILTAALRGPEKRSFAQFLSIMPNVGEDADFERVSDSALVPHVFD
jgi:antitoxin FitA